MPSTRTCARGGLDAHVRHQLDELAQHVVGARLGLLDAGDVLGAGDHDVVGEALGGDPAAVVADQRDRHQAAPAASASASITLRELPDVESASSTSPGSP